MEECLPGAKTTSSTQHHKPWPFPLNNKAAHDGTDKTTAVVKTYSTHRHAPVGCQLASSPLIKKAYPRLT